MAQGTLNDRYFTIGELDPLLAGFTDAPFYKKALKKARNVQVRKNSTLQNRPGTVAVIPGKFPTQKNREIPFKVSFNQQYDVILGNQYAHFIKNGKPIFNFSTVLQITIFGESSNPTITIGKGSAQGITTANFSNGMMAQIQPYGQPAFLANVPVVSGDFSFYCYNRWFIIQNVDIGTNSTTFTITDLYGNTINSTSWGTYGNNLQINTVYEIPTPYLSADLYNIKFSQSFDIMQLRHKLYPPQELSYTSDTNWTLARKLYWPSQVQYAKSISGSGGAGGGKNTYYKVSTYNETTGLESLPAPVAPGSPIGSIVLVSGSWGATGSNYIPTVTTALPHGLSVGNIITFAIPETYASTFSIYAVYGTSGSGLAEPAITQGVNYTITGVTTNTITFTGDVDTVQLGASGVLGYVTGSGETWNVSLSNCSVNLPSPILPNQIVSLSNTNPILVTCTENFSVTAGQEVLINGTGVFGIDGLTFNAIPVTSTTFYLSGVNGANYDLSTFTSSGSSIITTAIILADVSPTATNPITITGDINNASAYQSNIVFLIYSSNSLYGNYGYIGSALANASSGGFIFVDPGIPPDSTLPPKQYQPIFLGAGNYPSACNFYQERLVELATINNFQGLWASVIADYNDFTVHNPIQGNDAILINIWSTEMSQIFDSADDSFLILMTDMGPMVAAGDSSGEFSPSSDLIKRYMFAGSAPQPRPLAIFKDVLYVEANQASIRDLEILTTPYYTYISESHDISILSGHLLRQSPLVAWDYKLYPESQVYAVRADGKMIAITYFKEGQLNSFTWFDTLGSFQDIACVQEQNNTTAYVLANRTSWYGVEKFMPRDYTDVTVDAIFTDCTSVWNGQVNDGTTAVLSGTSPVLFNQSFTATLSGSGSGATGTDYQVGWQVNFRDTNNNIARMQITSVTANTLVGVAMEAFNIVMLGETIFDIRVASSVIGGLWNLEGQAVSVVADGTVVSNPNDLSAPVLTVTNGTITLPIAHGVINVGLPYLSDIQTLDIDSAQAETLMDKIMGVHRVTLKLYQTGDILVGPNFTEYLPPTVRMDSLKHRFKEPYDNPTNLATGIFPINIDNQYKYGGSIAIRNLQPLPLTLQSIAPLLGVQS